MLVFGLRRQKNLFIMTSGVLWLQSEITTYISLIDNSIFRAYLLSILKALNEHNGLFFRRCYGVCHILKLLNEITFNKVCHKKEDKSETVLASAELLKIQEKRLSTMGFFSEDVTVSSY